MIPSQTWFPTNLAARAAWYKNFAEKFAEVALSLGFTAPDIASVNDDSEVFDYLADADVEINAYKKAVGQYRTILTENAVGTMNPQFPANMTFTLPAMVDTGMFERLSKLVERIRVAPQFTNEIAALLKIMPTAADEIVETDVKPSIQVFAAQTGYLFTVVVTGRAEADMWEVLILKKGANGWQSVKTATGKSVDVTLSPTTPGEAEQLQVRVQLRKNNQNYGQPSSIEYVTINP